MHRKIRIKIKADDGEEDIIKEIRIIVPEKFKDKELSEKKRNKKKSERKRIVFFNDDDYDF